MTQWPCLRVGFWSWDWYWLDQDDRDQTRWGGPFYDLAHHQNPLPLEVAWYRLALTVLGRSPTAQHGLALTGFLLTLTVLYAYLRLLALPRWAAAGIVTLAGVAPSCQTSWTWFAASPHMWATALGLAAATTHLAWRRGGSRSWPLILTAGVLTVAAVAMKNDGVLGPLLILAWEWTAPRSHDRPPARLPITAMAAAPILAFIWWQATAVDPHRDTAQTGIRHVLTTAVELIRFAFITRTGTELRQEFPPGPPPPTFLAWAGAAVGATILALATLAVRERAGRILLVAGITSLGPVAVLQPALVSRYALPTVLTLTGAAGVGAASVGAAVLRRRHHSRLHRHRLATVATTAAALAWGALAHANSGAGAAAAREETALLAGLQAAHITPTGAPLTLRLINSPLDPTTAGLRLLEPTLFPDWRNTPITITTPGQPSPPSQHVLTVTRDNTGHYTARPAT
ncbi:MAG TPA: hypothetical protein VFP72_08205 [Kineosporiaceae bacterium]|nr:hypothetical protein [Kineosporiaceae bacterium]